MKISRNDLRNLIKESAHQINLGMGQTEYDEVDLSEIANEVDEIINEIIGAYDPSYSSEPLTRVDVLDYLILYLRKQNMQLSGFLEEMKKSL